jgi:glucuronide carrier protein
MTQDPVERSKLATFRVFGSNIAILLLAVVGSPQIEGSDYLLRSSTIALAVIGTGLYLFTFLTSRERLRPDVPYPVCARRGRPRGVTRR